MSNIDWKILTPPLADSEVLDLVRLLRTEWKQGDFDWIASLSGDYSKSLRFSIVLGRDSGRLAVTATSITREGGGEVGLISSVMTDLAYRGQGLGAEATDRAVAEARRLGARVVYLGTNAWPKNVYQKIGFEQWNGIVMRRPLDEGELAPEDDFFAPAQKTVIREAAWGDAPAFVALVIQPLDTCLLSFRHSIISTKIAPLRRCVSNYAPLYGDCLGAGGNLYLLAGESSSRIFGFAARRPFSSGLGDIAWLDAAAHDAYAEELSSLIEHACDHAPSSTRTVLSCCHPGDSVTRNALFKNGFNLSSSFPAISLPSAKLEIFHKNLGMN